MKLYLHKEHHGTTIWVRSDLDGKHREYCLCWDCNKFHPDDRTKNCRIANLVFAVCQECGLVLPVWECPLFTVK